MKPNVTEEEMVEYLNDPDAASKLLTKEVSGTAHVKLWNAVKDIEEKYKHIKKLERSVEEVYQLFIDLNTLIDA